MTKNSIHFLLFCMIFSAHGFSPLLSIASIGIFYLIKNLIITEHNLTETLIITALLSTSSFLGSFGFLGFDYTFSLAQARIIFVFSLLFLLASSKFDFSINIDYLHEITKKILLFFLVMVVIQYVFSLFGIYIYAQESWMALKGSGTLYSGEYFEMLREVGIEDMSFRAAFIYPEPSYFLLIVIATLTLNLLSQKKDIINFQYFSIALLTAIFAKSMYGIFGVCFIYLMSLISNKKIPFLKAALFLIIGFSLIFLFVKPVSSRILDVLSGNDSSAIVRFYLPFEILAGIYSKVSAWGFPISDIYPKFMELGILRQYEDPPLHNGFINIFLNSGILGFPILLFFYIRIRSPLAFAFFLIAIMQNGSFASWDKCLIVGVVLIVARFIKISERSKEIIDLTQLHKLSSARDLCSLK